MSNSEFSEEVNNLISELHQMSLDCNEPIDSENKAAFLGDNFTRAIEIGNRLNQLGGYNLMLSVHNTIPQYDKLELTYAWDGIGAWRV